MYKVNLLVFSLLAILSFCSAIYDSSSPSTNGRILGGTTAPAGVNRATVASIRLEILPLISHICGGFIINKRWVGTAAACLRTQTTDNTVVAVGTTTISGGVIYNVNQIQRHHNFDELTLMYDIGLLRTSSEIIFSSAVQQVHLSTRPMVGGESVTIYGWGSVAGGAFSTNLLMHTFTILTYANCLSRFPLVVRRFISDQHICTAIATGATCPGDAGGPIFYDSIIIGIVSWVEPCVAGQPNVNTRIESYVDWMSNFTRIDD